MSQEIISSVLETEQEAVKVRDDAQRQADRQVAEAEQAASTLREQAQAEAQRQVDRVLAQAHSEAEAERERILGQAEARAQDMEALAARYFDGAVAFVLDRVAGRG